MNALQAFKGAKKAVYCLQQLGSMHTAQSVQGGFWDAIKRAFGVSEQAIKRRNAYKYAERSARAGLAEQSSNNRGSLKRRATSNLNSDMVGDETMINNMTAYRPWKIENAGVIEERETLEKEEKSRMGK
ncbi:hypothetical protein NADE_005721 [Nannochloris sp. 'desiccata']|nr:hypothetical protein NADE_005721 [Chlorella desiccata (nom. nud.)]